MTIKKLLLGALTVAAISAFSLGESEAAVVRSPPAITAIAGDTMFFIPSTTPDAGGNFVFGNRETVYGSSAGNVGIFGHGNVDPGLSFSISVTDLGTPSIFSFGFFVPLAPTLILGSAYDVVASLTVGVSRHIGSPADLASISPAGTNTEIMLSNIGACSAGADLGHTLTTGSSISQTFTAYSSYTATPTCNDSIFVLATFQGSGNGDQYSLTGRIEIPEPMSITLLGTSVLGLVGVRRRIV